MEQQCDRTDPSKTVASRATRADPADDNLRAVARIEQAARSKRSAAECMSDAVTSAAAHPWSLAIHATWFSGWLLLNIRWFFWKPFDPFPFNLLTTLVSLEAIFLTLFVLASQNRLTHEADKRAHLDLQVNLLAEREMTIVLRMLKDLCDHFGIAETVHSEEFHALLTRTDVDTLAQRVEQTLRGPGSDVASDNT